MAASEQEATTIQTTLDGDHLVPVVLPDGTVSDVSKDAEISHVTEVMVSHAHSKPYGSIDWPQEEGFPIRDCITRTTEYAIRDALEDVKWVSVPFG